jgi:hypothetical protein
MFHLASLFYMHSVSGECRPAFVLYRLYLAWLKTSTGVMRLIIQKRRKPIRRYRALTSLTKNNNELASYRKTRTAFAISNRPVAGLLPVQKRPSTLTDKK